MAVASVAPVVEAGIVEMFVAVVVEVLVVEVWVEAETGAGAGSSAGKQPRAWGDRRQPWQQVSASRKLLVWRGSRHQSCRCHRYGGSCAGEVTKGLEEERKKARSKKPGLERSPSSCRSERDGQT